MCEKQNFRKEPPLRITEAQRGNPESGSFEGCAKVRIPCRLSSGVECFLGKEEVTGSIPVVGSKFENLNTNKYITKIKN